MGCGGCNKRRAAQEAQTKASFDVMNGHGNLPDRQIRARLEVYKKRYCKACEKRYDCNYTMYVNCRKSAN